MGHDLEMKYVPINNSIKEAFACKYNLYLYMFSLVWNSVRLQKQSCICFNENFNAKHYFFQTVNIVFFIAEILQSNLPFENNGSKDFYKLVLCLVMKYFLSWMFNI